jgi:cytohesin
MEFYYQLGAVITYDNSNLLCNAAFNGKVASVKWLLSKGEDANFSFTETGENALHYTLSKTSESGARTEIVKILIDSGADVNKKTLAGASTICFMRDVFLKAETPLHRAAAYANVETIKVLLDAGADPSIKDAIGDSPLSWGSWHLRDADVLRLLIYGDVAGIR